jgi:hypothetical protein
MEPLILFAYFKYLLNVIEEYQKIEYTPEYLQKEAS